MGRVLRFGHRQFSYNFTQGFSAPGVSRVYLPASVLRRGFSTDRLTPEPNFIFWTIVQFPPRCLPLVPPERLFISNDEYDLMGNDLPNMPITAADLARLKVGASRTMNYKRTRMFFEIKSCITYPLIIQAMSDYKADLSLIPTMSNFHIRSKTAIVGLNYSNEATISFDVCLVKCEKDTFCAGVNFESGTGQCTLFGC